MIYLPTGKIIPVEWSILRGTSMEEENFYRADIAVFLVGCRSQEGYKKPLGRHRQGYTETELPFEIDGGTLSFNIPDILPEGVYGLKAVWIKDGFKRMQSEKMSCFAISADTALSQSVGILKVKTGASTYGYDGLDAYELSVLHGKTSLALGEWVANLAEMNEKIVGAVSLAKESAREASNAADLANAAADSANKAVMNASGIEIDTVNNKLKFKNFTYDLTLSGTQPSPTPSGEKVVDKIIWGKPIITLEYNSQLPSAGGEISTRTFTYCQVKTITYKNGYPAEQVWYNDDKNASVIWGGVAGAEGKFTIEPNKSGSAREYVVTVKVTANGVESDETKLTLVQPSMTATGTIYRNLVLTLQYPDAEAAGGLITPSKFTYTIDEVTQYSTAGFEDVKTLSGNVSGEEIDHWANTDGLHSANLTVAASTIAERHALENKVKAWVNIYGVGKTVECEIWQKAAEIAETDVHKYEDLEVTSAYCDNIPASGGEVTPHIEYRLKDYVKLTDNTWRYKGYITTGCTIAYSGNGVDPTTGKVTKNTPSTSESESGVTTITYTISGYSLTKSGSIYVKQNGTGKQQEFMYVGSLASPLTPTSTDTDIEIVSNKRGIEEGNVSVSTTGTDKKKCHYLAIKIGSEYLVTKAVNVLGLDITDSVTPPMTIGSYNVYMLSSSAYISNTTTFTVSK